MARRPLRQGSFHVALLRGVNVEGRNKIRMVELRSLCEGLGFTDVRTFIQSGDVVFKSERTPTSSVLESAIREMLGVDTAVILRTSSELEAVLRNNPFPDGFQSALHVGFMSQGPSGPGIAALDDEAFIPERVAVVGNEVYLYLPDGLGRSKLPGHLARQLKVSTTIRNWKTVHQLVGLATE